MSHSADAESLKKISDMIKDIQVAMLTSQDGGHLRSRPMVAAQKDFNGELYFFTRASAHKVEEVGDNAQVNVSYADAHHQNYVSLSGKAQLVWDNALNKQHWSEAARVWFPKGLEDPDLAILKVDVEQAEYWDAPNSTMLHLYGYAKARLTGQPPHPSGNEKVQLS